MFGDCELCSKAGDFKNLKPGQFRTLFGGFNVFTCTDCTNTWNDVIHASPLWAEANRIELAKTQIQIAAHAEPRSIERAKALAEETAWLNAQELDNNKRAYEFGKKWSQERRAAMVRSEA